MFSSEPEKPPWWEVRKVSAKKKGSLPDAARIGGAERLESR